MIVPPVAATAPVAPGAPLPPLTASAADTPSVRDIFGALMRTLFEHADSKKSMTGLIGATAAMLSLVAGKQGWSWLDPQTSQLIAAVIVTKGLAVILAHMTVDKAKAVAQGPNAPAPDAPAPALSSGGGGGAVMILGDQSKA